MKTIKISMLTLASGILFLLAAAGFATFRMIEPRFDENGTTLIEPFFLLPVSWIMILIAVILGFIRLTQLAVQFIRTKKGSFNHR